MSALTALSRVTGFVRILVVAAVLGTTYLGNTYQSANSVPNLLFELFAAGALQAVLVPTLVHLLDRHLRGEAEHVAGSVLGLLGLVLAAVAALGMLAAPWIMEVLVSGVDDPAIREAQVRLGTFFLWFFLPQVVLYAAGLVATGVLNAESRFALPVFAPVVNNVIVIATYLAFWWMRDGAAPSLDITLAQKLVLAGGTTLGVVGMTAVPVLGVMRTGFSLRPRFDHRHPLVRLLGRQGAWAALFLALTQVLLLVVLILANGVEGGVVAYQVAFTFFLLPVALFAVPVYTTLFPRLSREARDGDWPAYAGSVQHGVNAIGWYLLPATGLLAALALPVARLTLFGAAAGAGTEQVAAALRWFAPGLLGYGVVLLLTRAFYADGDARLPALVNVGVVAAGATLMVLAAVALDPADRVAGLAAAHSAAYLAGAVALFSLMVRRLPAGARPHPATGLLRSLLAAAVATAAAALVDRAVGGVSRWDALVTVALGASIALALYLAIQRLTGGPGPVAVLAAPEVAHGP
ncbi:MAG: murein biosynthesis integral membrane protein MurJ [Acidimicrobiales bacterium]|nr:murein biosynthesis integral membrane protein MurJ [Acidimicrobiales bacterium]